MSINKPIHYNQIIVSAIALVIVVFIMIPILCLKIKKNHQNSYKNQLNKIELSTKHWANDNADLLPLNNKESVIITLKDLWLDGYIDVSKIDEQLHNTTITIFYEDEDYVYRVNEN